MSHHFTAEFTVLPPGKDPVSKKLQRENEKTTSAKRKENDQLDIDNKQMAWKLNQIKQAMTKEKEDRGKQGFIWKSGKSGNLDSYARNILGRSVSATHASGNVARPKKSPTGIKSAPKSKARVKVLRDEPLDLPQRDSATKDLIRKLKGKAPADIDTSESNSGDSVNVPNREDWISVAVDRSSSDVMELQSDIDGNLPISSVRAMDPTAIGVYFVKWGRKRLMMAVENVIRRPKTGWGSEVYYPYAGRFLPEMGLKPEPPLRNLSNKSPSPRRPSSGNEGGALLQGSFNEQENARLFEQAVNNWRQNKNENEDGASVKRTPSIDQNENITKMSVHAVQCNPPAFEVSFSETSTLSYMEHVLLEKHRKSDIPSMPGTFVDRLNDCLETSEEKEENILTADELEEREKIRELFSPIRGNLNGFESDMKQDEHSKGHLLIEEVIEEEYGSGTDDYIVDESPPLSPGVTQHNSRSGLPMAIPDLSTVVIEEMQYTIENSDWNTNSTDAKELNKSVEMTVLTNGELTRDSQDIRQKQKENLPDAIVLEKYDRKPLDSLNQCLPTSKSMDISPSKQKRKQTPRKPSGSKSARNPGRSTMSTKQEELSRPKTTNFESTARQTDTSITLTTSSVVKEIGKIPVNPDAIYHAGLNEFFSSENVDPPNLANASSSRFDNSNIPHSSIASDSSCLNPVSSIYSPDLTEYGRGDYSSSSSCNSADFNSEQPNSSARESVILREIPDSNVKKETNEQDEKTLDDLEWELASRTGNITTDGRISRIIDEWPEDEDLDIIDDPGLGSGLSTPDVDTKSLSATIPVESNKGQMKLDFQNMEQLIMADLTDEYSDSDGEL